MKLLFRLNSSSSLSSPEISHSSFLPRSSITACCAPVSLCLYSNDGSLYYRRSLRAHLAYFHRLPRVSTITNLSAGKTTAGPGSGNSRYCRHPSGEAGTERLSQRPGVRLFVLQPSSPGNCPCSKEIICPSHSFFYSHIFVERGTAAFPIMRQCGAHIPTAR